MLLENWKTTVAGVVLGGLVALVPFLQTGRLATKDLLVGFAIGVIGALAKDYDVTGGSRRQPGPRGK